MSKTRRNTLTRKQAKEKKLREDRAFDDFETQLMRKSRAIPKVPAGNGGPRSSCCGAVLISGKIIPTCSLCGEYDGG